MINAKVAVIFGRCNATAPNKPIAPNLSGSGIAQGMLIDTAEVPPFEKISRLHYFDALRCFQHIYSFDRTAIELCRS
jgi:predicted ABC-type sugar transport system permease subunit